MMGAMADRLDASLDRETSTREFGAWMASEQKRIFLLCQRMLQDIGDADSATQDTFIKAWQSLNRSGSQDLDAVAVLAQPRKIKLIDFRRQNEIALAQTSDLVGVDLNIHFAPSEAKIRMMALLLGHRPYPVHEFERVFEIGKKKVLGNMMLFYNRPVG
jgi:DNA-directed RNA polymerase specialized sigma24 family protein